MSAMMSSTFSRPTEILTRPGVMPTDSSWSSGTWRWVVDAGCRTQERASATWTWREMSSRESMNFTPASRPPLRSMVSTPDAPFRYFSARSLYGEDGRPG